MFDDSNKRRQRNGSGSQNSGSFRSAAGSFLTEHSDSFDAEKDQARSYRQPSGTEMLERARDAHAHVDFAALSAGPEKGGPWQKVEAADRFVVFKRQACANPNDNRASGLDVMCAGRLDASLEEVASVLRSNSEFDHSNTMEGLHSKNFIFGSLDREVPCSEIVTENQDEEVINNASEQLDVKTASFMRTTLFGHNEQWCFSDFFQRKEERDGFTISQCALPPLEPTPGRVVGANARVNQLHGLNASYLVDQLPNRKGLRVVYNAWFEESMNIEYSTSTSDRTISGRSSSRRKSSVSSWNTTSSIDAHLELISDSKAQLRRLLSLAHGVTKLPDVIRRRRFGFQVPADHDAIHISNARCPCCTHSLAPVKMSIAMAASAIAKRSLKSMKKDTRRCYLCGYLVCIDCWRAEYMESTAGRVAGIVVCTRCSACVKACDYSEVCTPEQDHACGPVKVVPDKPNNSSASLLTDFLAASLMNAPVGADRDAMLSVVRMMLQQSEATGSEYSDFDDTADEGFSENQNDNIAIVELGNYLRDETQLPQLESCVLANAEKREFVIDLPDDPVTMVPPCVIPAHDELRLKIIRDTGLLQLACQLAPLTNPPDAFDNACNVQDLNLLCQLALKATGCAHSFVTIMGEKHNHVLAATNPAFFHAVVPREQTMCQHTIMTTKPFVATHPEADVRFHEIEAVKALSVRFYVGFPVKVPILDTNEMSNSLTEMPVGTLCCLSSTARSELTRSEYATMNRLCDTASRLIQLKGRQIQEQLGTDTLA